MQTFGLRAAGSPALLLRSSNLRPRSARVCDPCQAALWAAKTLPPLPYGWRCLSGFEEVPRALKIHMSETIGIERLWSFQAGYAGCAAIAAVAKARSAFDIAAQSSVFASA